MPLAGNSTTRLHYDRFGEGPQWLLAFHGFAQDCSHIKPVAEALGDRFTVLAFDLFYHGQSTLAATDVPLRKERLEELIGEVLNREGITRFSLLGFSMGGKFALSVLESYAPRVELLILVAPDGIGTSFWYNLATYPGWLQQLFKRTVLKPNLFLQMVNLLRYGKLIPPGLARFTRWHLDTAPKRLRVYQSWVAFRDLTFDLNQLSGLLNQHQIKLRVFLGRFDQVISPRQIQKFTRQITGSELILLPGGHTLLIRELASHLRSEA